MHGRHLIPILIVLLLAAAPARAGVVLDAYVPAWSGSPLALGGGSEQRLAQTFTARRTGAVDRVDLVLACSDTEAGSGLVEVALQGVLPDGSPDGVDRARVAVSKDLLGPPPIAPRPLYLRGTTVEAGERYAIVVAATGADDCAMGGSIWDTGLFGYPHGEAFYDARPNPPGWLPLGPDSQDLAFWLRLRTGSSDDPLYCGFEDAAGLPNDWLPNDVPVCGCLEDPASRANRCWFALPELLLVRELPLPLELGKDRARYSIVPLREGLGEIGIEDVGANGGFLADPLVFDKGLKPGRQSTTSTPTWFDGKPDDSVLRLRYEFDGQARELLFRTRLQPGAQ